MSEHTQAPLSCGGKERALSYFWHLLEEGVIHFALRMALDIRHQRQDTVPFPSELSKPRRPRGTSGPKAS